MTKNNLSTCLSWLLQHPPSFGSLGHISVIADPAAEPQNEPEEAQGEHEMARLQLAPQAPPRPRLHTGLNNDLNPLPTPAPSRPSEEPKPPSTRPKQTLATPSSARHALKPRTPVISFDNNKFDDDVLDIDEIDLTGDTPGNVTTSSFDDFGPPMRLWMVDAAARVEPLPATKGKKRKSDEYGSDLLRPPSSRKITKASQRMNATISPLPASQTGCVKGHAQEEHNLTQATIRPGKAACELENDLPDFNVDEFEGDPAQYRTRNQEVQQRPTPTHSQQSRLRVLPHIVPGSDDDDEEAIPAPELESQPPSPITSVAGHRPGPSSAMVKAETVGERSRSPVRSQPTKACASPRNVNARLFDAGLTPQTYSSQDHVPKSSAASSHLPGSLTLEQKKLVDNFATKGQGHLESLLKRLEQSKKTVDDKIMDEICECGAASTESKETLKTISRKLVSTTRLRDEFGALVRLHRQREQMIAQRDELRTSGHCIDADNPEDVLMTLCSKIYNAKREISVNSSILILPGLK